MRFFVFDFFQFYSTPPAPPHPPPHPLLHHKKLPTALLLYLKRNYLKFQWFLVQFLRFHPFHWYWFYLLYVICLENKGVIDFQNTEATTNTEAAARGVQWKKVFLEISQNSQENTCARASFLIKLQASCNFCKSSSVASNQVI